MGNFLEHFCEYFNDGVIIIVGEVVDGVFAVAFDIDYIFTFEDAQMMRSDSLLNVQLFKDFSDSHLFFLMQHVNNGDAHRVSNSPKCFGTIIQKFEIEVCFH